MRLELLLEPDFQIQNGLEGNQRERFQNWQDVENTEEVAYFFLDSVDEAKLQNPRALDVILSRFVSRVGAEKLDQAKVFVTSRFSEWRVESDLNIFRERLLPPSHEDDTDDTSESKPSFVYRLDPLVDDPSLFIKQVHQADAASFAQSPQDLIDLIAYWQDHNQQLPEKYIDLIQFSINKKLREVDESRAQQLPLSHEDAYLGAELLAAATTLCKKNTIRLPETEEDIEIRQASIDASPVMPKNWESAKQRTLMMRPIFDPEIYGTIRFHHRSTREFLTAKWLLDILNSTITARGAVNELLFATKYGHQVVIPSMQPVAAWLACWDKKVRKKIADIAPEVLVEYGDPSVFPVKFRILLLENLVGKYQEKERTDLQLKSSVLKRLASDEPKMLAVICSKLKNHSKDEDLCRLFLEIVRQGMLADCTPASVELVEDQGNKEIIRVFALRSIMELGSTTQQEQVLNSLFAQGADGRKIISWDCGHLFPDKITVQQLISIIEDSPKQGSSYSSPDLSFQLDVLVTSVEHCDSAVLVQLIEFMHRLLKQEPYINLFECGISDKYAWIVEYALHLANHLLERRHAFCLGPVTLDIFWMFLILKNNNHTTSYKKNENILQRAKEWKNFSYQLLWHIAGNIQRDISPAYICNLALRDISALWAPHLSDWDWLINEINKRDSQSEKCIILKSLYQIYCDNDNPEEKLVELKRAISGQQDLNSQLENWLNPPVRTRTAEDIEYERTSNERDIQRQQEAQLREEQHRRGVQRIQANSESLRKLYEPESDFLHTDSDYLYSVIRHEHKNSSMQISFKEWEALIPELGVNVAEAFRDGCIRLWRDFDPTTLEKWRDEGYHVIECGLRGLAMESSYTTDWLSFLSTAEARRAAIYATCEMNNYPEWFASLQQAFPDQVNSVLIEEAQYELFGDTESHPRNLSRLNYNQHLELGQLTLGLIQLIEATEKSPNIKAAESALSTIIGHEPDPHVKADIQQRLSRIAIRSYHNSQTDREKPLWLRILFAVDANQALVVLNDSTTHYEDNPQEREQWAVRVFSNFSHEGRHAVYSPYYQDYTRLEILERLVPLAYELIKEENDIKRGSGTYTPTDRDDAQAVRFRLLDRVTETPGGKSHDLLTEWAAQPLFYNSKDWIFNQAKRRAEEDSEFDAWEESQVLEFTEKYHKYRDNKMHSAIKMIVDHPRTSAVATIIAAVAAVLALFGSPPPPSSISNEFNIQGDMINSIVRQGSNNSVVDDAKKQQQSSENKPGNYKQLIEQLTIHKQAIKTNPNDIEAYNKIGLIQLSLEKPSAAVEAFEQVLRLAIGASDDEWQGVAYRNLGLAYAQKRNLHSACMNWKKGLDLFNNKQLLERAKPIKLLFDEKCQNN